ncbi:MAG: hypothetical protein MHMPM18_003418 [Marteilia pararefringens]
MAIVRDFLQNHEEYRNITNNAEAAMRCQSCLLVTIWSLQGLFICAVLRNIKEQEQFYPQNVATIFLSSLLMAPQGLATILVGYWRSKYSQILSMSVSIIILVIQSLIAALASQFSEGQLKKATLPTAGINIAFIIFWSLYYCRLTVILDDHENEFESNRNSMKTKWFSLLIALKQACIGIISMDIFLRGNTSEDQQVVHPRLTPICIILIIIHWLSDVLLIFKLRVFKKMTKKELKTKCRIFIVLSNLISFIISMVLLIADMSESPEIKYSFLGITIAIFVGETILYVLIMNGAYTDNEVLVDNFSNENCRSESNLNHNPHSSDDESSTQNRNQASREIHGFQELHISDHPPGYYDIYPDASRDMGTPPPYENQSNNGSFSTASNVSSNEEGIQVTDREPVMEESDIEDTQL